MKSTEATVFDRKSGAAEGPAVRPSQTQLRREYREFLASAAPFAHSRLAGAVSAGSAADSAVCFAAPVAASRSAYFEEACSEEACSAEAYFAEAFAEEASAGPVWSSAPD
jgi:hypothetical protein